MSTYSTQLFAGDLPVGQSTLYTATAAFVTVVRHITFSSQAGSPVNMGVWLGASGLQVYLLLNAAMPTATVLEWTGRQVMTPGQMIQAYTSSGTNIGCWVSGYQLSP